ncbi:MAG: metallophosphoesterase [Prevotella sp.]|jgi:predicted MPP superfamily phosphohydrolase
MIARIIILILLAIVLPDLYFDQHYWKRSSHYRWWHRLLWWLPGLIMVGYTVGLSTIRNFVPDDLTVINVYLLIVGLFVIPKALVALCSVIGLLWCRLRHSRNNWGNLVALFLTLFTWYAVIYGSTLGVRRLRVKHIDLYFDRLPASFDGYRIVHFSDAHVGSFTGARVQLLKRDIDSINAQHADLIAFTGDLQNIQPSELYPVQSLLSGLHARDGVVSVLGNHDYAEYIHEAPAIEAANERETINRERQFGWQLLRNEHFALHRGNDSIVIAGEENYEKPARADFAKTLKGIEGRPFTIMLQHVPAAWREQILPSKRVDLTLSGHTHGGQMSFFGLRPTHLTEPHDYGLFQREGALLYVNPGLGGLVFFRFGMPAEITVFTLHRTRQ